MMNNLVANIPQVDAETAIHRQDWAQYSRSHLGNLLQCETNAVENAHHTSELIAKQFNDACMHHESVSQHASHYRHAEAMYYERAQQSIYGNIHLRRDLELAQERASQMTAEVNELNNKIADELNFKSTELQSMMALENEVTAEREKSRSLHDELASFLQSAPDHEEHALLIEELDQARNEIKHMRQRNDELSRKMHQYHDKLAEQEEHIMKYTAQARAEMRHIHEDSAIFGPSKCHVAYST